MGGWLTVVDEDNKHRQRCLTGDLNPSNGEIQNATTVKAGKRNDLVFRLVRLAPKGMTRVKEGHWQIDRQADSRQNKAKGWKSSGSASSPCLPGYPLDDPLRKEKVHLVCPWENRRK